VLATAIVVTVHVTIGLLFGPYAVGHSSGSFEETSDVARAASIAGVVLATLTLLLDVVALPRSVPFSGLAIAVTDRFAARFSFDRDAPTWPCTSRAPDGGHLRRRLRWSHPGAEPGPRPRRTP